MGHITDVHVAKIIHVNLMREHRTAPVVMSCRWILLCCQSSNSLTSREPLSAAPLQRGATKLIVSAPRESLTVTAEGLVQYREAGSRGEPRCAFWGLASAFLSTVQNREQKTPERGSAKTNELRNYERRKRQSKTSSGKYSRLECHLLSL